MLYIATICMFCRFFCLLTIKIFSPPPEKKAIRFAITTYKLLSIFLIVFIALLLICHSFQIPYDNYVSVHYNIFIIISVYLAH